MKKILSLLVVLLLSVPAYASLTFGGATTHRVEVGSDAELDDLSAWTVAAWVFVTTRTDNRRIFTKIDTNSPFGLRSLHLDGTAGNLEVIVARATTDTTYTTNNTPIATTSKWYFVAATYDIGASAGELVNIYIGDRDSALAECAYGTTTDGSGSLLSDAAAAAKIANNGGNTQSLQGRVGIVAHWNRVLTIGELRAQQHQMHVTSGCVGFWPCGANGTTNVPDWSGNGNTGTITGATLSDNPPLRPFVALWGRRHFLDYLLGRAA